jgi:hypothetical protein
MRSLSWKRQDTAAKNGPATESMFPQGMKILNQPLKTDVDIVFVHGLTGDRDRTWTKNETLWPKSLLTREIPNARVMTYGYDAYFIRRQGPIVNHRLRDHAVDLLNALASTREKDDAERRPIVFVVHSLGGLVCKDALLVAHNCPEQYLRRIFESTHGIVFMGTPHSGSSLADMARLPMRVFGLVRPVNSDLVSILETHSEVLERIQSDFLALVRNRASLNLDALNIFCFYESLPMPKIGFIVPKESAILPGYQCGSIRADHRDIVRYETRNDPGFTDVVGVLKRWINSNVDKLYKRREAKRQFLQTLAFPGIEARRAAIGNPAQGTCSWVFGHRLYRDWERRERLDHSNGLLWIKGKPGSGKSVLMKQIVQVNESSTAEKQHLCLSFFFNARGALLERSPIGLYRSLLHQLIQQSDYRESDLISLFIDWETKYGSANISWTLPELRDIFHSALIQPNLPPIMVFVDALDECTDEDVRLVVRSFEECALKARQAMSRLDMCWSSRHYPYISVKSGCFELRMEDQNASDIANCVEQQLMSFASKDFRAELLENLTARASGVFLWAVVVVRKLLIAEDQGRSLEQMRVILRGLPSDLDGLFKEIIKSTEPADRQDMLRLMRWVLFSSRPLTSRELRLALGFGGYAPPTSFQDLKRALGDELGVDHPRFERRIIDLSGGLIEIFTSGRKSVVQFIHESVRDFLLGENKQELFGPKTLDAIRQEANQRLAKVCGQLISWTNIDLAPGDLQDTAVFLFRGKSRPTDCGDFWITIALDSILKYALDNFFKHAVAGEDGPLTSSEDTGDSLIARSRSGEFTDGFLYFHGLTKSGFQNLVWWNTRKGEKNREGFYACLSGLNSLQEWIIKSLAKGNPVRDANEIFSAAAYLGLVNLVQAFCEAGHPVGVRNVSGRVALHEASMGRSIDAVKVLVNNDADVNVFDWKHKTPLFYAIERGEIDIVTLLLASGSSVNIRDEDMRTPLQEAATHGQVEIVKALITSGADVNAMVHAKVQTKVAQTKVAPTTVAPTKVTQDKDQGRGHTVLQNLHTDEREDLTAKISEELLGLASSTGSSAALFSAVVNDHQEVAGILRAAGASLSKEVSVSLDVMQTVVTTKKRMRNSYRDSSRAFQILGSR